LRYENALTRESLAASAAGGAPLLQELLTVELGRVAAVTYLRDVSQSEPRVLRGAVAIGLAPGDTAALPEQGVMANVRLASLDVDAWEEALARAAGESSVAAAREAAAGEASQPAMGYLPTL